ncbi:glycosyl-4,4'-diaponeurosporenoate acyltransferase [Bacillus mesophilum]|uniref:Glycosyl-4,4'-diaponeurosporenoate acyltransferase n=1 Tax=Bacillus mesophilum TaxID=1071718 RepID=A0A7V7UTP0_9BACI|nr:glycosyl-4,4'-diaponeurosporenoate acyltransferase [Bacillus mesophilum]KAB2330576.1 glycosyl-4,4'-diaponeurosporenoate acyltransferase [Bacillus mesophilum]
MPIVELPLLWLLVINILAWPFIHIILSLWTVTIPIEKFMKNKGLYKIRNWERSGEFWDRYFHVKRWKDRIPDGTKIIGRGFEKSAIMGKSKNHLRLYVYESRRAEFNHWLSMLPALLFFLWNPLWAGMLMIAYALFFNIPIIIVQRFNRARLEKILKL